MSHEDGMSGRVVVPVTDVSEEEPPAQPVFVQEMRASVPSMGSDRDAKSSTRKTVADPGTPGQAQRRKLKGAEEKKPSSRQSVIKLVDVVVTKDPTSSGITAEYIEKLKDPEAVLSDADLMRLIFEEFPAEVKEPSLEDIDSAVMKQPETGLPFETGQWIERLGNDMVWHLEPIRRVVRTAEGIDDFKYFYKTSAEILVDVGKARAPQEGLQRHFGMRPWAWQQWANLRVEAFVRFQKNHDRDFDEVSYVQTARFLWDIWYKDPRNKDFQELFEAHEKHVQDKLIVHMMQPFRTMDEILTDWDFDTTQVSVYQYASFLGSGFPLAVTVMIIQLLIPFLILDYQVRTSTRFPNWMGANLNSYDFADIFGTSWNRFCYKASPFDQVLINFVVFIIYMIRVFPAVYMTFYQTIGDMDTITSKLNSIRIISWLQGDDTPFMQIGFKMDRYMNTLYIALINVIMMFVLFLTESTTSVILNALALEFVYMFDKEISKAEWYDDNYRFLKVAIMEIIICAELRLELDRDHKVFCEELDIDPQRFEDEVGGALSDWGQARRDHANPEYCLTAKDRMWMELANVAKKSGRNEAMDQFLEPRVNFGVFDNLVLWLGLDSTTILSRYGDLYTWSRWDKVLFLSRVPRVVNGKPKLCHFAKLASNFFLKYEQPDEDEGPREVEPLPHIKTYKREKAPSFANFNPSSSWSPMLRFAMQVLGTFMLVDLRQTVGMAIRRKFYVSVPIRFFDSLFEIAAYLFVVMFPVILCGYGVIIWYCNIIV